MKEEHIRYTIGNIERWLCILRKPPLYCCVGLKDVVNHIDNAILLRQILQGNIHLEIFQNVTLELRERNRVRPARGQGLGKVYKEIVLSIRGQKQRRKRSRTEFFTGLQF